MKFKFSPFSILDKNMSSLDYQKRNHIYEDYWRNEISIMPPLTEFEKKSKNFLILL